MNLRKKGWIITFTAILMGHAYGQPSDAIAHPDSSFDDIVPSNYRPFYQQEVQRDEQRRRTLNVHHNAQLRPTAHCPAPAVSAKAIGSAPPSPARP